MPTGVLGPRARIDDVLREIGAEDNERCSDMWVWTWARTGQNR